MGSIKSIFHWKTIEKYFSPNINRLKFVKQWNTRLKFYVRTLFLEMLLIFSADLVSFFLYFIWSGFVCRHFYCNLRVLFWTSLLRIVVECLLKIPQNFSMGLSNPENILVLLPNRHLRTQTMAKMIALSFLNVTKYYQTESSTSNVQKEERHTNMEAKQSHEADSVQ